MYVPFLVALVYFALLAVARFSFRNYELIGNRYNRFFVGIIYLYDRVI